MPIKVTLDAILTARRLKAKDVAAAIGVSETHLSLFRSGKVKGVRFETLAKLCAVLDCKPGDILDFDLPHGAHSLPKKPVTKEAL